MVQRIGSLLLACLLGLIASPAVAHEGAEDVAWVYVSGNQANGRATVRVDVAEHAACDRLEPIRLEAIRAERDATGSLAWIEPCRFEGEIALPEAGRWIVTARFAYDDREAEVQVPVGVTDAAQAFERGDWLHAVAGEESGSPVSGLLLYAGLGLGIGAALTLAYRLVRSPRPAPAPVHRRARGGG